MKRRFTLTLLLAVVLCVALPAGVFGQVPQAIIRKPVLGPDDIKVMEEYVKPRLPLLADPDPTVMKKARDELLSPFKDLQITVAFRQGYNDIAMPQLKALAARTEDVVVVNALRVAAELATSDASMLLEQKIADPKVAIRFGAVNGIERTMTALANRGPAIPAPRVEQLVDKLGKVVADPANTPEVIDAGVRALIAARNVGMDNVKRMAVRVLSSSVGKVAARFSNVATPLAVQQTLLRAGQAARDAMGNPQLNAEAVAAGAELCGHLLGWSFCQLNNGLMPQANNRETAAQIVNVAETTIVLACQKSSVPVEPQKLSADFEKAVPGNDNQFIRNITKFILALRRAPFNLNNQFLNCKPPG